MVALVLHAYWYGPVPPIPSTFIWPLLWPLHNGGMILLIYACRPPFAPTATEALTLQLAPEGVTVTEYVPAATLVIVAVLFPVAVVFH